MSKLTDKEWVELIRAVTEYAYQGLRVGQSYMNALHKIKPELYKQINGTDADCFYSDDKIINFINYINGNNKD